jgi:2-(3-amino-3-carboxypropyl)histidine synthase
MFSEKDTKRIISDLKKRKARRILVQVPEGLKTRVQEFATKLEEAGFQAIVSVDPCYGACDLRDYEAKQLGCDLLLHVGHSDFGLKTRVPAVYEEYRMDFDPIPLLRKNLPDLRKYGKICLATTVQFLDSLNKAKKFLESRKKKIYVPGTGQVLGCNTSAVEGYDRIVDCFLFLGSGTFHPLGIAAEVRKPVLMLNFETGDLINLETEKAMLLRIRAANVEKAKDCTNFGILVSTKPGQMSVKAAMDVKKKLDKAGRKSWILAANELTHEKIMGMKLDCLVNTACPRLSEDVKLFRKPIIYPEEVGEVVTK